jgi:hypothetical protein
MTEVSTEILTTIESFTEPVTSVFSDDLIVYKLDIIITLLLISFIGLVVLLVCYVLYKAVDGFLSF